MKINFSRLEKKLLPSGFELASVNAAIRPDATFVRGDATSPLYQQIYISLARRGLARNEVANAELHVTPLKWHTLWEPWSERRILKEVASNAPAPPPWNIGHWDADIKSTAEAKAWEDLLARVGPPAAAEFATQMSPAMLERTMKVRAIASRALAMLDPTREVSRQLDDLRRTMGQKFAAQAEMATSAIGRIPAAADIYELAGLAVANDDECKDIVLAAQRPLRNDDIDWPVYLVADAILSWDINEDIRADLRFLGRR